MIRLALLFILIAAPVAQAARVSIHSVGGGGDGGGRASSGSGSVGVSEGSGGGWSGPSAAPAHSGGGRTYVRPLSNGGGSRWNGSSRAWGGGSAFQSSGVRSEGRTRIVPLGASRAPRGVISGNGGVARSIARSRRVEIVPNRYYWHNENGYRYTHYYYRGHHWYGFYDGPSFYWTRYHANHWWWYDPSYTRWAFWSNGYWWWPGPGGLLYVYVDNAYYPYDQAPVTVERPTIPSSPSTAGAVSAPSVENHTFKSPDGRREIQVVGASSDAFLYDTSSGRAVFMKALGSGVERVRFTGGTNGIALQFLIDFKDGHFSITDSNGAVIQTSSAGSTTSSTNIAAPEGAGDSDDEVPPIPPPSSAP